MSELPIGVNTQVTVLRGANTKINSTRYKIARSAWSHSARKGELTVSTAHILLSRGQKEAFRLSYLAYLSLIAAGSLVDDRSTSVFDQQDGTTTFVYATSVPKNSECPHFSTVRGPLGTQPVADQMCSWKIKIAEVANDGSPERLQFILGGLPVPIGSGDETVTDYFIEATFQKVYLQGNTVPLPIIRSMTAHVITNKSSIVIENKFNVPLN